MNYTFVFIINNFPTVELFARQQRRASKLCFFCSEFQIHSVADRVEKQQQRNVQNREFYKERRKTSIQLMQAEVKEEEEKV